VKWEYKVVYFKADMWWSSTGLPSEIGKDFDQWGAEGWELVKVEPILRGGLLIGGFGYTTSTVGLVAFFKRQK
jgi:hypothetical protein